MKIPKIPLAQTIVQLCKAKGIKHIIISPGSRNAPLTIGFTNDSYFKCYSIVDERCAAFFALGIAQQIKHPVALVCTSGSALLNYFPAVAEAFYSDIPLVVLSADRPKYLVGIGDGQTIDQNNVYGSHVLYASNLKLDLDDEKESVVPEQEEVPIFKNMENRLEKVLSMKMSIQQKNEQEINKALNTCISLNGPVHLNCPFDEPLYLTVEDYSVDTGNIHVSKSQSAIRPNELKTLQQVWNTSQRILILIGVNAPHQIDATTIEKLAKDERIVVLTETTSNIHHNTFFPSIDKLIMPLDNTDLKALQPDLLVTLGGMIVSKKVKAFLRKFQPKTHWHVDKKKANDTFFCLSKHIKTEPQYFFKSIISSSEKTASNYFNIWNTIKQKRTNKHDEYLLNIPFSDLKVFDIVLKSIQPNITLHLGNSSTVRYTQLFNLSNAPKVFCNRGTSGIDGSTSTAIGGASVLKEQNVFITGDLSFFYDSNALWNNYIPNNFRIILINNEGGGIFRILPGHKNTSNFDEYFETKHHLTAKQLCEMYNFEYTIANDVVSLKQELKSFYADSQSPKLLEIFTPRQVNDEVLLEYFEYIR